MKLRADQDPAILIKWAHKEEVLCLFEEALEIEISKHNLKAYTRNTVFNYGKYCTENRYYPIHEEMQSYYTMEVARKVKETIRSIDVDDPVMEVQYVCEETSHLNWGGFCKDLTRIVTNWNLNWKFVGSVYRRVYTNSRGSSYYYKKTKRGAKSHMTLIFRIWDLEDYVKYPEDFDSPRPPLMLK